MILHSKQLEKCCLNNQKLHKLYCNFKEVQIVKRSFFSVIIALFIFLITPIIIHAKEVILGGNNIGIELKTPGLMVSGTYDVGSYNPSKDANIKKGDIIIKVNGQKIASIDDFIAILSKQTKNEVSFKVELLRKEQTIFTNMKVIREDSTSPWKTGLFVKERILGTGTLTYYDPENHTYGALGHKMSSADNASSFETGNIFTSYVNGIKKSSNGNPGQKIATINEEDHIGDITFNNEYGIYGNYKMTENSFKIETASINEVQPGKAYIYTVLDGDKIEKYEIEIIRLKKQNKIDTKGISFKIVDEKLLKKTGGVVSGMSGSPIVQNGKLIGAVTHVVVDKVNYGHGIYIDWMLEQSNIISKNKNLAFFNKKGLMPLVLI
ncbi:MAG: SpoIVB peptidase [Erysipelotrichaceae bacterium]|nr:SpoIVB peptidase [Erysipelotrichaceae bacterium]